MTPLILATQLLWAPLSIGPAATPPGSSQAQPALPPQPSARPAPSPAVPLPPPATSPDPAGPPAYPPAPATGRPVARPAPVGLLPGNYPQAWQPRPPPRRAQKPKPLRWFFRAEIGAGSNGFGENNSLLSDSGFGSGRLWVTLDGAGMFGKRLGFGAFMSMSHRGSSTESGPTLHSTGYFVGPELPIVLAGNRRWTFHATPRVGYANVATSVTFAGSNGSSPDRQSTGVVGGALNFQSFEYHMGVSVGFMHAPAGAPDGSIARTMDYGGLYFAVGGSIDG